MGRNRPRMARARQERLDAHAFAVENVVPLTSSEKAAILEAATRIKNARRGLMLVQPKFSRPGSLWVYTDPGAEGDEGSSGGNNPPRAA